MTPEERFFAKVDKTDYCWNWTGGTRKGYGLFRYNKKVVSAHIASYEMFNGDRNGLVVRHTCDNGLCVNPDHLVLGTYGQNTDDMMERDRHRGLLRNEQVEEVRRMPMSRTIIADVSAKYGIPEDSARNIINGTTFSNLPGARDVVRQKSRSKLTIDQIKEIKVALQRPYWGQVNFLAKKYGVDHSQISHIKSGLSHSDITIE